MGSDTLVDHHQIQPLSNGESDGSANPTKGFDLKEKLAVLWRRKGIILATVSLITLLTGFGTMMIPPSYVAVASVLIEGDRTNVIDDAATGTAVIDAPQNSAVLAAEINLLHSQTYAREVIQQLGLLTDPEFNPFLPPEESAIDLVAKRAFGLISWLPDSLLMATGLAEASQNAEPADVPVDEPAIAVIGATSNAEADRLMSETEVNEGVMKAVVEGLLSGLRIKAGASNLIVIEFSSNDPRKAADIANKVADIYVMDQIELKRAAVDDATLWLENRVNQLREKVLASEAAVIAFKEQHSLNTANSISPDDSLAESLTEARAVKADKQRMLTWARELSSDSAGLETLSSVLSLSSLDALREEKLALDRREASLRNKYGPQHREILLLESGRHPIDFDRKLLESRVAGEFAVVIRRLEGELAFASRRADELQAQADSQLAAAETEVLDTTEVQLRDLERQAEADRSVYLPFLSRLQEVNEQRNLLDDVGTEVATRAGVPADPVFPKPKLMMIAGFMVSLSLGTMLAFLREYFDSGMRTGRQLERLLGLPNLGYVPHVNNLPRGQKLHSYLINKPRSAYAEAIRAIQIVILDAVSAEAKVQGHYYELQQRITPVVLVTSSLPGEGKTTLALSLGASAACSGRHTIVVDLDLRRPRQHQELGLNIDAGLGELLMNKVSFEETIHTNDEQPNLDILPVGQLPDSPADLLCSPNFEALVSRLREQYDYVVLDSPPLLGVVDAKLASRFADAILFVTRWEKTKEQEAKTGIENLIDQRTPPIGGVLTQVDFKKHAKKGYGEMVQYYSKYDKYYNN